MLRRRNTGIFVLSLLAFAAVGSATGASNPRIDVIKQRLVDHGFSKPPLFPADVPANVGCCRVIAGIEGQHYMVSFLGHGRKVEVGFFRDGRRLLGENLQYDSQFDPSIRRIKVDGQRMLRVRFRGSGLAGPGHGPVTKQLWWHQQGYTYVFSDVSKPSARIGFHELLRMAASTERIG